MGILKGILDFGIPPTKKKKVVKKKEVAGPYRSQSSVPSIKKQATKHEHRKVQVSPKRNPLKTPTMAGIVTKAKRQQREYRRLGYGAYYTPPKKRSVATLSAAKREGGTSRREQLEPAVDLHVTEPLRKAGYHETTGQKIYKKVAEYGPSAITFQPELAAGAKGVSAALRGVELGESKLGGTALTKAVKATTPSEQAAVSTRLAEKAGIKAESGVAKRTLSKIGRTQGKADRAVVRKITGTTTRKEAAAAAGLPLKAAKAGTGQTLPVVRGHEEALLDNPGKTLKTTARILPGLVTVPVGMAAHVGTSAGRAGSEVLHEAQVPGFKGYSGKEIVAPIKGEAEAQIAFVKQIADVVTASDSKYVKEQVENNLGLLLPLMAGLGTKAVLDKVGRGRVTEGVRKLAEKARRSEHGDFRGETPHVFEKQSQNRAEAKRAANAKNRIKRETADRTAKIRAHAGQAKGAEVLRVIKDGKKLRVVKIHTGDWANFLIRNSIPLDDPVRALAEIKRIKDGIKPLPDGVRLDPKDIHTRDIIENIEKHPNRLRDPALKREVAAYKADKKYERENAEELAPEHSERARFLPTAITRNKPLPEEIHPHSVRDIVRAEPTRGKLSKDVLRKEAHEDRVAARALQRKARARDHAARREATRPSAARRPRAELEARVRAARAEAKQMRAQAASLQEMAKRKHHALREVGGEAVQQDFVRGMERTLKDEGLPLPEVTPTSRARQLKPASGVKISQTPGRSKVRQGTAEEHGMVQEDLGTLLREGIARPVSRRESYKALRSHLVDNEFKTPEGKSEFSEAEANTLFDSGVINRNRYVAVPRQAYKRALKPEEAAAALADALAGGKAHEGAQFKLVRKPAAEQFLAQQGADHVFKNLSKANRATAFLILGTSPAWAAMQIIAEYSQAAIAQPQLLNPLFIKKANDAYNAMSPQARQEFESWVGVTNRVLDSPKDIQLGLKSGDMEAAAKTYGAMNTTPYGKFLKGIPNAIRNIDTWKGGRIRALTTIAKVDKDLNGSLNRFMRGMGNLYREGEKVSKDLAGKPLKDQLEFVSTHPEWAKRYQSYLDDVMGNWSALTKNERMAAQLVIFYPFLRMSLKWTFQTFPRRHPIKAAMLAYLGQQNANELSKLLGGDPSYFTQWAQVPLHLGDGETKLVDLSRIAPGSNAIVEALGESGRDPLTAGLRVLQPGVAAAVTAATGVIPLTGKQEHAPAINAAAELMSLSPLGRVADKALLPEGQKRADNTIPIFGTTERQNSLDKLFATLRGSEAAQYARTLAAPVIPKDTSHQADVSRLSQILDRLSMNSSTKRKELAIKLAGEGTPKAQGEKQSIRMQKEYGRANGELDKMFQKYRVPYKKENERFLERYGDIYYAKPGETEGSGGGVSSSGPVGVAGSGPVGVAASGPIGVRGSGPVGVK